MIFLCILTSKFFLKQTYQAQTEQEKNALMSEIDEKEKSIRELKVLLHCLSYKNCTTKIKNY
jgi:hypothetical protein